MIIGYTGTQDGMTFEQLNALRNKLLVLLSHSRITEAHQGMCVGGDAQFHNMIRALSPNTKIIGHPGFEEGHSKRSKVQCDVVLPVPKPGRLHPCIQRNHDIVAAVDIMYAAPKQEKEVMRSGTWATIRWSWKMGKQGQALRLYLILPSGTIQFFD